MINKENLVESLLLQRGIMSAGEIAGALAVSQPTVSRIIRKLGPRTIARIGKGKSTQYGLRRQLRGMGDRWPLYYINHAGRPQLIGYLNTIQQRACFLELSEPWSMLTAADFSNGVFPGLPWFMQDMQPRGFLGRIFAQRFSELIGAPRQPESWSDDDRLVSYLRCGADLPGAFIIGETMLEMFQQRTMSAPENIEHSNRAQHYPQLAEMVLKNGWPGSSAAGEQPKFTACVCFPDYEIQHVIVKFSGAAGRPEDRRWADLLIAEHIANTVLQQHGIACARTAILQAGGRTFLESIRFDRSGASGRCGLVSLESIDSAFFGKMDTPWTAAAQRLFEQNWITHSDHQNILLLWWFGTLIANTDMHYGNISFLLMPGHDLQLAPVYDMVPMMYRPDPEGRLISTTLTIRPAPPEMEAIRGKAAGMATVFWQTLADTGMLSDDFRGLAEQNARSVRRTA